MPKTDTRSIESPFLDETPKGASLTLSLPDEGGLESRARYEMYMGVLDGIFEPRAKKALVPKSKARVATPGLPSGRPVPQKRTFLTLERTFDYTDQDVCHPDAILLRLTYPDEMDVLSESLLLAAVKLGGDSIRNGVQVEMPLASLLSPEFDAIDSPTITFETSSRMMMREAGMAASGADYKIFARQLERLSEITMHYENRVTHWRGSDFLFRYKYNVESGRIVVSLNWKLSGAILGRYMYSTIDLNERRSLGSDAAKTLHRWLSTHRWEGKGGYYRYDTLAGHIWSAEASPEAMKKRMQRLKKDVLPAIGALEKWDVSMERDRVLIRRRK